MPTTLQDAEPEKSSKELEGEGGTADKQDDEATENGSVSEDKNKEGAVEGNHKVAENSRENLISEATTLLAQGKRHLFVKDYPSAVTALGDACSKFSEIYGELADECVEAYFNYGTALLELAREDSGVLEVENKESDQSEEGEEEEGETEDSKKGNETEEQGLDSNKTERNIDDKSGGEKTVNEQDKLTEGEEKQEEGEEEEEDVNNLQLSWEMFELAKVIFTRQNDEKKLADTYLRLGEVALESENYDSAITDIQSCLDLQKKTLPPVSREIAETIFQLGVACSLCNQFDNAIKHFTAAGVILEKRIQNLSKMSEPEPEKVKNPFYTISNEIEEIKALLPEIKDKIADMEEFKNETMKAVVQATINNTCKDTVDSAGPSTNGKSTSSATSSTSSSKPPANDISHLIRKKRKNDDDASDIDAKKQCSKPNSNS